MIEKKDNRPIIANGKYTNKIYRNIVEFTYMHQSPARWTFEQPLLRKWVEDNCKGEVLNLFAGRTELSIKEVRNDLNEENPADYHMDAYDLVMKFIEEGKAFDTIILDPPYSLRKSMEKYFNFHISKWTKLKKQLPKIVRSGGRVITLGYNSIGFPAGFRKTKVCLVCHHNSINDTICLIEEKVGDLRDFK